jgi:hypothetical protein
MAGIPKRWKGERNHSYSLRCWEAELTRRDNRMISHLEKEMRKIKMRFEMELKVVHDEWEKYLRAKPGTKYDITARKKK